MIVMVKDHIRDLINELQRGEYKKYTLYNSSQEISGQYEAIYFSHVRKNIKTDIANLIMNS